MAMMTSLYLCNRDVHALVGRSSGKGVKITTVCHAVLPEGCLINGVITNEGALVAALQEFFQANGLPKKNVCLVVNSSQFQHRTVTVPAMPEKKLRDVVQRELNTAGEAVQPLDDYMVLEQNSKDHSSTLLAMRIEKSLVDSYMALAEEVGLHITCIDLALACEIKLIRSLPALAEQTFIMLVLDGSNLYSTLYETGQYKYSTRTRLFNSRGTPESGTEIVQKISGIVQFQMASKSTNRITNVYFAGATKDDLAVCAGGLEILQLEQAVFPEASNRIKLPDNCALADSIYTVGNLIGR